MSQLTELLKQVAAGTITPEEAEREIQSAWYFVRKGSQGEPINCDALNRVSPSVRAIDLPIQPGYLRPAVIMIQPQATADIASITYTK